MTYEHNLIALENYGELAMKKMKRVFVFLGIVVVACPAFAGDVEVVEIPRLSGAVAGPCESFGCCCSASRIVGGNSSTLALRSCESIGGYCMTERRAPVVIFDLESIPEGAAIESVRLVGSRTSSAGSSDGRLNLLFTSSGSINHNMSSSLNNSPHATIDIDWAGSGFSHQIDPSLFVGSNPSGYLAILMYTWHDTSTYVRNSTNYEPTLEITIFTPAPPCPADMNGDGIVDSADLGILLAYWGAKSTGGDLNEDGVVDAADLGSLLASWGNCPSA